MSSFSKRHHLRITSIVTQLILDPDAKNQIQGEGTLSKRSSLHGMNKMVGSETNACKPGNAPMIRVLECTLHMQYSIKPPQKLGASLEELLRPIALYKGRS